MGYAADLLLLAIRCGYTVKDYTRVKEDERAAQIVDYFVVYSHEVLALHRIETNINSNISNLKVASGNRTHGSGSRVGLGCGFT
jgi:hypothetical protein